jgi:hypothetical protein
MKNLVLFVVAAVLVALNTGCTLYSDVQVNPLFVKPGDVRRPATGVIELSQIGDYPRAIALAAHVESKERQSYKELAALGAAEMAAGRLNDARRHLRRALELRPVRSDAAGIAWDLSQTEFLANNYAAAKEWALLAGEFGLNVRKWHMSYMEALATTPVYTFSGAPSSEIYMTSSNPNVPRVTVRANGQEAVAIVDTGAVLSIVSEELATKIGVKSLGDIEGTFYGLLGEPIAVRFGLIETLAIGRTEVANIPVAIMGDEQLSFFVTNRKPFKMDLLLGANLLKEFRIELDFFRSRARFSRLAPQERRPAENQNLFFVGFRPLVHATVQRRGWYLFVLDTGSEITFLNEAELLKTTVRNLQKVHGATLQGLGGTQKRGAKLEDVEIGIDKWAGLFRHIPLYHTEQTTALGIIGENFLKQFTVTIDFGAMRVSLQPPRREVSAFDFETSQ